MELNRAAAVAMRDGSSTGLAFIDAILVRGVRWAEENQPTVDLNRVEYEKRERKRANLPL
jgi:hypothetical protein